MKASMSGVSLNAGLVPLAGSCASAQFSGYLSGGYAPVQWAGFVSGTLPPTTSPRFFAREPLGKALKSPAQPQVRAGAPNTNFLSVLLVRQDTQ